jgi:hypothetical protein
MGQQGFWTYQSFVAPSSAPSGITPAPNNEAFVAVSNDGGFTWQDKPISCSVSSKGLDHIFPNISVAPNGALWATWSDDQKVYTATSPDHGNSWSCSGAVSSGSAQAVMPWLVATSSGVDLVYYGAPTKAGPNQTWYVYLDQNLSSTPHGWNAPQRLFPVHKGPVCEEGANCSSGRQLFDDFGVDTDMNGWAHIAYSHDAPDLGGQQTYTGSAVQTGGTRVGVPNN